MSAVMLAACAGPSGPTITSDGNVSGEPQDLLEGDVIHVVDGDTFALDIGGGETTVRLLGVNAPEHGECFHDEASAGLALYLEPGNVGVEGHGQDQFGRTLGYVWAGETFVNLALVEDGLAIATTPDETETRGASLLAAEEAAYQAGIGLWDACDGGASTDSSLVIDTSGHNPAGADDEVLGLEHVTISNSGDEAADISAWLLRDESSMNRFRFPGGSIIGPNAEIRVASDSPGWEPGGTPVWNNGGDLALLLTPNGAVVVRQRYGP